MRKKIIWTLLIIIVAVSFYVYREYNRKPADLSKTKPAFSIAAKDIANEFETDETAATKKYAGKIIEVTGVIASAVYQQDTLINLILGEGLHKVGCQLDENHTAGIQHYQETNTIIVKGVCTGYLMNVELNRCVIVK